MTQLPFVDTNVLLYLISADAAKAARVEPLLAGRVIVSVQVLNEFANVARRKHALPWPALTRVLADIRHFATVRPLTLTMHERALALAERYRFGVYDALIAAAALEAGCETLLTEDLQHGQVLEKTLTIRNPFV
ncbi:MAG: PIN domain-containing protein [Rubrivivax sp.]|nr:PIN domain-containing protein [Rubrivivax sp.]